MAVYQIDPVSDPRWEELLARNPDASVFHTQAWLQTLRDTYGYRSLAVTTSAPREPLRNGLVFSHVESWITGSRLVSLPFADHCQPLLENQEDLSVLLSFLDERVRFSRCRYVELRPVHPFADTNEDGVRESASFCFHVLPLSPDADALYQKFHKKSIQRMLERSEREGITIIQGHSEKHLNTFYRLLLLTRRRHALPPQPQIWFRNLARHFGQDLVIWIALKSGRAIAAILTLASPNTVVYKYGVSDAKFHHLGAMPALIWRAILYAKSRNATVFDMGRSDPDNSGLITFKDRWGTERTNLTYFRSTHKLIQAPQTEVQRAFKSVPEQWSKQVFAHLPNFCLIAAGRLLYRHLG